MRRTTEEARKRRKSRIRKKLSGTQERPRLVVYRSNAHVYAQLVDDVAGVTLVQASSLSLAKSSGQAVKLNKDTAANVGKELARMAKEHEISRVVFDRNGYLYHGRVKALADGAREGGLEF